MTWGQQQRVGRFPVGWSAHRELPLPLSEAGCPSAPPWGVVHGGYPHVAAPKYKTNQIPRRHRQSDPWLLPPWRRPWPGWGSPTQSTGHISCALQLPHLPGPEGRQCHSGVSVPSPKPYGHSRKTILPGNDWEGKADEGRGRCWCSPTGEPISFLYQSAFCRKRHILQ